MLSDLSRADPPSPHYVRSESARLSPVDMATVRELLSPTGRVLLADLPAYDESAVFALSARLRQEGHSPDLVAALLTQQRLRAKAKEKFGDFAADLLFTADGLEQATRLEVAATHAQRFAAASLATVHDLGCGIGADAVTLSVLGVTVAAIDADPVTAAIADANLRPWPESRARVGRAEDFTPPPQPMRDRIGVWLDPARRTPGVADIRGRTKRTFRLSDMSPSWESVLALAATAPATGAKLSPSFPHDAQPRETEAQWVSYNGSVVECAVWWGPLARTPGRTALVLTDNAAPVHVTPSMATEGAALATGPADIGGWLYEPDRAVTRAGLLGAVTAAVDGVEVDSGVGYVLAERSVDLPYARRYAVEEAMPFSPKAMRGWLRDRGITGVTIKKRGIAAEEDQLRRQLGIGRKAGSGAHITLVLTPVAGTEMALVVTQV